VEALDERYVRGKWARGKRSYSARIKDFGSMLSISQGWIARNTAKFCRMEVTVPHFLPVHITFIAT